MDVAAQEVATWWWMYLTVLPLTMLMGILKITFWFGKSEQLTPTGVTSESQHCIWKESMVMQ
jgi:hypothetical protein